MCVFLSRIEPVLALKVRHGVATKASVPLSCGEAYENQRVLWKKNGNTTVISNTTFALTGAPNSTCADWIHY